MTSSFRRQHLTDFELFSARNGSHLRNAQLTSLRYASPLCFGGIACLLRSTSLVSALKETGPPVTAVLLCAYVIFYSFPDKPFIAKQLKN